MTNCTLVCRGVNTKNSSPCKEMAPSKGKSDLVCELCVCLAGFKYQTVIKVFPLEEEEGRPLRTLNS